MTPADETGTDFDRQEKEQILRRALSTTAEQRFRWLEETLALFADQIRESQRREPKRYF